MNTDGLLVIAVYEADDLSVVDAVNSQWSDIFEITTASAMPAEKVLHFVEKI